MKYKEIGLLILIATLLQGTAFLLYPGHTHSNDYTLPLVAGVLLGFLFCLLTRLRLSTIVIIITISNTVALICKIIVDMQVDPTSHNLFPFEIIISAFIACIAAVIGAAVGLLGKRLRKALIR
jgi:hypothetical protein